MDCDTRGKYSSCYFLPRLFLLSEPLSFRPVTATCFHGCFSVNANLCLGGVAIDRSQTDRQRAAVKRNEYAQESSRDSNIVRIIVTGIINAEGAMWKEQRKFLHKKLREFGMTVLHGPKKKNLESKISVSILDLKLLITFQHIFSQFFLFFVIKLNKFYDIFINEYSWNSII